MHRATDSSADPRPWRAGEREVRRHMSFPVGLRARLGAGALATLALTLAVPVVAQAAGCPDQPSSRPFAPWGDDATYVPAPDGGFENAASGWRLGGGAAVQDGNQDTQAAGEG